MTYGIPYTVNGWPDTEIVTTVEIPPSDEVEGYTAVVRAGDGPVILVPTVALTPVDTTPPEPEPGAWDLNGVLCVRDAGSSDQRWYWCLLDQGRSAYTTWKGLWAKHGGSGITPRRLVPEAAPVDVKLPWRGTSMYQSSVEVGAPDQHREIPVIFDFRMEGREPCDVLLGDDTAEDMAHALLASVAAARAAREATP